MSPASDIGEFIRAWQPAKSAIEERLAESHDIHSGVLDPISAELGVWHGFVMKHLKSVDDYELRMNGVLDLSDYTEDLKHSLASDEAISSRKPVDFEIMGISDSMKNQGCPTRVDILKIDLADIRDEIDKLYDQRRRNVGYKWFLDRAN
jgi:hypothetical protein